MCFFLWLFYIFGYEAGSLSLSGFFLYYILLLFSQTINRSLLDSENISNEFSHLWVGWTNFKEIAKYTLTNETKARFCKMVHFLFFFFFYRSLFFCIELRYITVRNQMFLLFVRAPRLKKEPKKKTATKKWLIQFWHVDG